MQYRTTLAISLLGVVAALESPLRTGAEEEFRMRLGGDLKVTLPPLPSFPKVNAAQPKDRPSPTFMCFIFVCEYSRRLAQDVVHLRAGRDPDDSSVQDQRYRPGGEKTAKLLRDEVDGLRAHLPSVPPENDRFRRDASAAIEAAEKVMLEWSQLSQKVRAQGTNPPVTETR